MLLLLSLFDDVGLAHSQGGFGGGAFLHLMLTYRSIVIIPRRRYGTAAAADATAAHT